MSLPEGQFTGFHMLLHKAEALNKLETVPFNREVLLLDLEGPLANLIGIFIVKTICLFFVFTCYFSFLPPDCKLQVAWVCVWLVHCECQCLVKCLAWGRCQKRLLIIKIGRRLLTQSWNYLRIGTVPVTAFCASRAGTVSGTRWQLRGYLSNE